MPIRQLLLNTRLEGDHVNRLIRHLRQVAWIRIIAPDVLQVSAAYKYDGPPIARPLDLPDILSIVVFIGGKPMSLVIRRGRAPKVPRTAFIQQPDDFSSARSGMHFRGKR